MRPDVILTRAVAPRGSTHQEAGEPQVYALVLVGDVEEAPVAGDRDALDTRQAGELANEGCFEGAGVGVLDPTI
jgi:hypothetical protein